MKAICFIYDIFKNFPLLISINIVLVISMGIMDAASIFSLAPVIDVILPNSEQQSGISQKVTEIFSSFKYGTIFLSFGLSDSMSLFVSMFV